MSENVENNGENKEGEDIIHDVIPVSGMYENWFLDYASYVILERAVPAIEDGFKPVQRRIMHSLKEMDDGRYNKIANVIGSTMQYHPHGDASIGDAIVHIGQKDLLIDTQGNWGDTRTGDSAAASRYIEGRLSKFALDVIYNPDTTDWQLSYDGRKKEPITLPVKFPLLLAQGAEGIAVGLSTKILPHNFCELIKASIDILKGKRTKLLPDFPNGGMADFSEYNRGQRGGKVRVRSNIQLIDKKTLAITDVAHGVTTNSLIESIIKANDKGKIKIKQVVDNTAKDVEVLVTLAPGISPDITIDALYAFTDCEVSISPNTCVIIGEKPRFIGVDEVLKINTDQTVVLLTRELEIRKGELLEKLLFSSLEKIFIENRIYRDIEECETWEAVIKTIDKGLTPFKKQFYREITEEDIVKLTEIKIKRISKFDSFKADELMRKMEEELAEVEHHLANIIDYAIAYFEKLMEKYGKGKERRTEIKTFDTITANVVAANNQKLYVNRADGFVGYGMKKDEYICDCSDIDDIIAIRKDGKMMVSKVSEKVFMGKNILYAGVFKKNDERMVYNMVYLDGASGRSMIKRFQVLGVTRDKEYDLTKGSKNSKILYLTANPNGEAEVINIGLSASSKARVKSFDFDFSTIEIKGRGAGGNILTKYPVRKIVLKSEGVSTLSGLDIWYDDSVGRLNRDNRGGFVGNFNGDDKVLIIYKDGSYELTSYELTNRYEQSKILLVSKLEKDLVISAIHYDGTSKNYYVKRFIVETTTENKRFPFISESTGSKLVTVSISVNPKVEIEYVKGKSKSKELVTYAINELIEVKGWKAIGNKIALDKIKKVTLLKEEERVSTNNSEEKKQVEVNKEVEKVADVAALTNEDKKEEDKSELFEAGETIELDVKGKEKDDDEQLGLFDQ